MNFERQQKGSGARYVRSLDKQNIGCLTSHFENFGRYTHELHALGLCFELLKHSRKQLARTFVYHGQIDDKMNIVAPA
jgi:hypothetical protein